jgi:hypothetical protein
MRLGEIFRWIFYAFSPAFFGTMAVGIMLQALGRDVPESVLIQTGVSIFVVLVIVSTIVSWRSYAPVRLSSKNLEFHSEISQKLNERESSLVRKYRRYGIPSECDYDLQLASADIEHDAMEVLLYGLVGAGWLLFIIFLLLREPVVTSQSLGGALVLFSLGAALWFPPILFGKAYLDDLNLYKSGRKFWNVYWKFIWFTTLQPGELLNYSIGWNSLEDWNLRRRGYSIRKKPDEYREKLQERAIALVREYKLTDKVPNDKDELSDFLDLLAAYDKARSILSNHDLDPNNSNLARYLDLKKKLEGVQSLQEIDSLLQIMKDLVVLDTIHLAETYPEVMKDLERLFDDAYVDSKRELADKLHKLAGEQLQGLSVEPESPIPNSLKIIIAAYAIIPPIVAFILQ